MDCLMTKDGKVVATHKVTVIVASAKPLLKEEQNIIKEFIYEKADKSRMLSLESLDFSGDDIEVNFYVSALDALSSEGICHPATLKTGIRIALSSLEEEKIPFGIKVKDVLVKQLASSIEEIRSQFVILY